MDKEDILSLMVTPNKSIREAIVAIDKVGMGLALVVNDDNKLLGIVTDGDIRRAILKNMSLETVVKEIMNTDYTFVTKQYSSVLVENLFYIKPIKQIPVLDDNMRVMDIITYDELYIKPLKENYVLIMAGGLGTRLMPLTYDMPKPMLKVGAKPILETIIEQLKSYGYVNILLSVNYKSEVIKNYFQDGTAFGVNINYIEEKNRMGTGGAIKLAEKYLQCPFFVINGDILTKLNFESFMEYHNSHKNCITIASRKHELQIPYGVIEVNDHKVVNLKEKPVYHYFINGGLYCLEPETINYIPKEEFFDITSLISILLKENKNIGSFPIREYWMDIGQMNDFQQANLDYYELFGDDSQSTIKGSS